MPTSTIALALSFHKSSDSGALQADQRELEVTEREARLVHIAGLCHDLGHGPFSHSFEKWIHSARPNFHHEHMSGALLRYLIDDNALEFDEEDIQFIETLISGDYGKYALIPSLIHSYSLFHFPLDCSGVAASCLFRRHESSPPRKYEERAFLFDIVANKRNSVDVDKFDYLARGTSALLLTLRPPIDYCLSTLITSCISLCLILEVVLKLPYPLLEYIWSIIIGFTPRCV